MMYAGDEEYDDDVTSGIYWDNGDMLDREDYEPSPYDGTYSED